MNTAGVDVLARGRWWAAFVAFARAANTLFFVVTATYCILTYSSFAYQQFLRPRLVSSLASFVIWHHIWHWLMLGLTAITLVPELRQARGRALAWSYLAAMTIVGAAILAKPILPSVENDSLGLRLAFLFLLPPAWLAVFDHVATAGGFNPAPSDDRRLLISILAGAAAVWAMQMAAIPFRFDDLGDLTLSRAGIVFGAATSLIVHVVVFFAFGLAMISILRLARLARHRGTGEYWLVVAASALAGVLTTERMLFASLSFHGWAARLLAVEVAVVLTTVWSGISRRAVVGRVSRPSSIEAWFAAVPGADSALVAGTMLLGLPFAAFTILERVATFDWDFLVQNLCVLGLWLLTCVYLHALVRPRVREVRSRPMAVVAGMLLLFVGARGSIESSLAMGLTRASFVPEFALDGFGAVDPSYRLLRHMLRVEPAGSAEFYEYLRSNSLIQHTAVAPIDVDFVTPLAAAPGRPPHVFLFVVDSLRRDYVSVYNPSVGFTPEIDRFAADSDVFTRAFARYTGTGLSMPAIWAGGMLLHKEYVLPFSRMNALEKLLKANRYRSLISMDHITAQLLASDPSVVELDRGRDEMEYDFCATLGEIESRLPTDVGEAPIFAHTRSLNLHVSKLTGLSRSEDPAYDGFQAPAAVAIRRMDACFGRFIDVLRERGLYDESIIILTSDHGDSLGEAKRWGHSYALFPEIVRTPLIVRVPARIRAGLWADLDAASFSTDITPTLYALLGYSPASLGWVYGSPLFVPQGTDTSWRRRETFLIAASYGPAYGLLQDNGRALYIADGVNRRDFAYDIAALRPVRVGVTEERRAEARQTIRERLADLARMYRFSPES